jgi:hypothetical protein
VVQDGKSTLARLPLDVCTLAKEITSEVVVTMNHSDRQTGSFSSPSVAVRITVFVVVVTANVTANQIQLIPNVVQSEDRRNHCVREALIDCVANHGQIARDTGTKNVLADLLADMLMNRVNRN